MPNELIVYPKPPRLPVLERTPRYLRWPVLNSERRVVGHELLRIGPDLNAYIRKMAEEARQ